MAGTNQVTWTDKVNTRTLAIPIINKIDDTTVNQLKQKHNALDTEMTDPTTGLKKVVEDLGIDLGIAESAISTLETDLGIAETAITTLGTNKEDAANKAIDFTVIDDVKFPTTQAVEIYVEEEVPEANDNQVLINAGVADIVSIYDKSTVFTVSFQKSAEYGTKILPIYAFLSVNLTNARNLYQAVVRHSGLVEPTIFDNIWTTPSATYADQAAMIADQVSQTVGLVYNYGMNYWRYLGTVLGTIDDYEVVQNIIYTGDFYLTGVNNLNILTFTYKEFHGESTYRIKDAILVNNLAIPLGNEDPNKPVLELLINLQFENKDISIDPSIINNSFYSQDMPALVSPNTNASYIDLGGGNFSLRTNTSNNNTTGGTPIIQLNSGLFRKMMSFGEVSVITKVRRTSSSSANECFVLAYTDSTNGFRMSIDSLNNRFRSRINATNYSGAGGSFTVEEDKWLEYSWVYSDADNEAIHYARSTDYTSPVTWGAKLTSAVAGSAPIVSSQTQISLNSEISANNVGKRNNVEYDYIIVVADKLPSAVLEDIHDDPTNAETILRTYYGY